MIKNDLYLTHHECYNIDMTIQDINCFIKLAETLNYTKTAEALFISQPAVTRHINALEEDLGFLLFDRSVRRKVVLTENGKLFYKGLKKCADTYDATLEKIHSNLSAHPLIINLLRGIRFPDSYVKATTRFMQENPSFKHFTNFIEPEKIDTVLSRGEIIICQKEYLPTGKSYRSMKLTGSPVCDCIIATKGHPAFSDAELNLEKLRETTLFLPQDLPDELKKCYLTYLEQLLGSLPNEVIYLDSMDSVFLFLRSGRCFTICNSWHSETHSSELRTVPIPLSSDYYALWDSDEISNSYLEQYLKALRDNQ